MNIIEATKLMQKNRLCAKGAYLWRIKDNEYESRSRYDYDSEWSISRLNPGGAISDYWETYNAEEEIESLNAKISGLRAQLEMHRKFVNDHCYTVDCTQEEDNE